MVGVLMIMCGKRSLLHVLFERDTQGRRDWHKQILLVVGSSKRLLASTIFAASDQDFSWKSIVRWERRLGRV